jgi:hypothetical protein
MQKVPSTVQVREKFAGTAGPETGMKRRLALILCCAFALTGVLSAKQKGRGHDREEDYRFRQADIRIVAEYYRSHGYGRGEFYDEGRGLPPGLAKRGGDLPPGLAKQLRRNGHLPPGLEKRFVPFPVEVERRLPPCPYGMRRGLIDGVAVMLNVRTGVVVDFAAVFGN